MKREIKFRGKTNEGNRWIVGAYNQRNHTITWDEGNRNDYYINDDTIGQYTGLKDKNGKEIYEGDIIRRHIVCEALGIQNLCNIYIHWGECGFVFRDITNGRDIDFCLFDCEHSEVIGNIHDNKLKDFGNE